MQRAGTSEVAEHMEESMEELSHKLERLSETSDQLATLRDDWFADARKYVTAHPFAAVGLAFGAGYLVRTLLRRRH
jgi:ElaB/YqjD/DUF883 family membrane-anchored ribosome-binding protein